ncbi:MAG: hypothetical protein KA479_10860 [Saprospiraceae bacterium]|nr:hypothetical protein [Saprospiraceae bacterium]
MKNVFLSFFVAWFVLAVGQAQPCDIPQASEACEDAPIFCNVMELNGYCMTMSSNVSYNGPSPLCPNGGAPHNTSWFAFYASCTSFEMTVEPSNCAINDGIQVAIYQYGIDNLCSNSFSYPDNYIVCQVIPCFTTTETFMVQPLVIGQIYYVLVDGCSADVCEVVFSINTPCDNPPVINPWISPIEGPLQTCTGSTTTYAIPKPLGAFNLHWYLDGNLLELYGAEDLDITWSAAGTYELCVSASNPCVEEVDGPGLTCVTIVVEDIIPVDPPPLIVCEKDSMQYPCGISEILLKSVQGCDSIVTLRVECIPNSTNHLGVFPLCADDSVYIEGNYYTCAKAGQYEMVFQNPLPPYCDSIIQFEVSCISAQINGPLILSNLDSVLVLDGTIQAPGYSVYYSWSTTGGILPNSTHLSAIEVRDTGLYCLKVDVYADTLLYCSDSTCVTVSRDECNTPAATDNCENAPILCTINILDGYCTSMVPELTYNAPNPLCGAGGNPHNPLWFAFYASCESLELKIIPTNCVPVGGQIGIQAAIYGYNNSNGFCTNSNQTPDVEVACFSAPCFTSTQSLIANNLIIGQIYYMVVDGCAGSYCDIEIEVESACNEGPQIADWSQNITGPLSVCENATVTYQMPLPAAATMLSWYLDGTLIHQGPEDKIDVDVPAKTSFELCVDASNLCVAESSGPAKKCIQIEVLPEAKSVGRTYYTCKGSAVLHEGVYWSCEDAGTQQITFQQKATPYCDSIYSFEIICLEAESIISPPDKLFPQDSFVILDGNQSIIMPPGVNTELLWEAFNGGILSGPIDQPFAKAQAVGQYCLTVRALSPNKAKVCSSTACVDVIAGRTAGLNNNETKSDYRIWPQPASDKIMVEYFGPSPQGERHLIVQSITGSEVIRKKWSTSAEVMELSVSHLADGIYTLQIMQEDGQMAFMDKIIIIQ